MPDDAWEYLRHQSYDTHLSRNSSEVIDGIISKTGGVVGVINSVITLLSAFFILIGVVSVLVMVNPKVTLLILLGFSIIYVLIALYVKFRLVENSRHIASQSNMRIKALQEGLGGIRDTIINGNQEFFCRIFQKSDLLIRKASASSVFISQSPKYIIEAIGMILIVIFAYSMIKNSTDPSFVIPVLGVFALGSQKVLPALQQIYVSYSAIKGGESSFNAVLTFLRQPLPSWLNETVKEGLDFSRNIRLRNVDFKYCGSDKVILKNINLNFKKGERIGIVGETGVGKSTLVDLIMGLLEPSSGKILIDDKPLNKNDYILWQRNISHVPQNIYLSDGSIEENVAFGIKKEKINHQKIKKVIDDAQLTQFVNSIEDGYKAFVGEHGAKLSGGQRQRIGIARALYKDAKVLILDEATSALDKETEVKVMNSFDKIGNNLTIFIIAHRLSTLKNCDYILRLNNNKVEVLNYEKIKN